MSAAKPGAVRIAFFVHDINDPAVARRTAMLQAVGATVTIAGFRRDDRRPISITGAEVIDLGLTRDGDLRQRAAKVAEHLLRPATILRAAAGTDVVIGRNLESLALAARARRAAPGARLVYECLDIHRSLLGRSLPARGVQWVEGRLLGAVDLVLLSSPAFAREYFARRPTLTAPILLVENKPLMLDGEPARVQPPQGPPWTIGWFGNLRCRRTFDELSELARVSNGRVRVLIAGRPSPAVFDDFDAAVEAAPGLRYVGPYTYPQLPALYGQCHFAWGIDYFEEGLNSRWLLPSKLYEASSYGAVPIALGDVETGHWLARHGAGLLLDDGDAVEQLRARFAALDEPGYRTIRGQIEAIARSDLIADARDCTELLAAVSGQ